MKPRFFRTPTSFRAWLSTHQTATELWVGFYRKGSGKPGMTYPEGVDAALCYGWIDGHKKRVDELSFTHRFSPRRKGSIWSTINTRRFAELDRLGQVTDSGRAAFALREVKKSGIYTYERKRASLPRHHEREWKALPASWAFFNAQPPGYQRMARGWIMNAKREETQRSRLARLIELSDKRQRMRW